MALLLARHAPNCDIEVMHGVIEAFNKIGEDESERSLLRRQLAKLQAKEGIFGTAAAKVDAVIMCTILKVLSQPISSSSAERAWSTYSYILNAKRNCLNATRADKLIFIHSNIRLISRFTTSYNEGPYRKWDIDPESS